MNYDVIFDFNTVSKRGLISGKKGKINVDSSLDDAELLKTNPELIKLIAWHMKDKTKKDILSVDITSVILTKQ